MSSLPPPRPRWHRMRRLGEQLLSALDLSRLADRAGEAWTKAQFRRERQRQADQLRKRELLTPRGTPPAAAVAPPFSLRQVRAMAHRAFKRHQWPIFLAVLLLAGLVLAAAAKPAWAWLRQWRCDTLVAEAQDALNRGEWKEAYHRSASALMLRDSDRNAGWILMQAMRAMGNPKALELGYWLFAWPELPKDRRQSVLALFADRAPEAAFFGAYNSLPPPDQALPTNRASMIRVLVRRKDYDAAARLLEEAPDRDTAAVLQVESIRLLCARRAPGDLDAARRQFLALQKSEAASEAALEALRLLHSVPEGTRPRTELGFPVLEGWLAGVKTATTSDRLIAADQRLTEGTSLETVVSDVVDQFGRLDPGETAAWLNRHQRHDQAIALATPTASRDPVSFRAVVEAQIALKHRDAARRTLGTPPQGFHPVDLARLHLQLASLGNEDEISEAWARLLSAAEEDPDDNRAYELVALAEAEKRPVEYGKALSTALRHRWGTHPMYSRIEPLLATLVSADRTWEILEICRNIARYEPENAPLQNNLLYLQCLTGEIKPDQAVAGLQRLLPTNPGPDFALSLAFAHLANGQPQDALDLVTPLKTQPGPQSFLRHVLAGSACLQLQRHDTARFHLDRVSWEEAQFLPEEIQWFQQWGALPSTPPAWSAVNSPPEAASHPNPKPNPQ